MLQVSRAELRQHTPLYSVLGLAEPPFKMTVSQALGFIGPDKSYGLGTLKGVEGELTVVDGAAYVTRKDGQGGQITELADPEAEVHFVQGINAQSSRLMGIEFAADDLNHLKVQIRDALLRRGMDPSIVAGKIEGARVEQVTLRTVNGNELVEGEPHETIGSIIQNQLTWTTSGAGRVYSGFLTNSMSASEAEESLGAAFNGKAVTAAADGYIEDSLLHTHLVGRFAESAESEIDEGGHVLDFKGFRGMIWLASVPRTKHMITFARAADTPGLRPAFSVLEQGDVAPLLATGHTSGIRHLIEGRDGENQPLDLAI